jgi:hypothetical protein
VVGDTSAALLAVCSVRLGSKFSCGGFGYPIGWRASAQSEDGKTCGTGCLGCVGDDLGTCAAVWPISACLRGLRLARSRYHEGPLRVDSGHSTEISEKRECARNGHGAGPRPAVARIYGDL